MARKVMFKNLTTKQKMELYLKKFFGAVVVEGKSSYLTMRSEKGIFYFLGGNGAVRACNRNCSTDSVSKTDAFKTVLARHEAELQLAYENEEVTLSC